MVYRGILSFSWLLGYDESLLGLTVLPMDFAFCGIKFDVFARDVGIEKMLLEFVDICVRPKTLIYWRCDIVNNRSTWSAVRPYVMHGLVLAMTLVVVTSSQ